MALIKTPEEIEKMQRGGALLSSALKAVVDAVKPGAALRDLDIIAEKVISSGGGKPSFKGHKSHSEDTPFPSTLCISIDEEIVHGLGDRSRKLKEGEIVGLDIGCWFEGLCTDMAVTVPVGDVSEEATKLMKETKASLYKGIEAAALGSHVSDIGAAVEAHINPFGYGIVRALVGHGVGHKVHEDPRVPNFIDKKQPVVELVEGMCLAIEPMIALGSSEVSTADDGWAVVMSDGSLGAHFEMTIAITKDGPKILTPLPV